MVWAGAIDLSNCLLKLNFSAGLQSIRTYALTYQGKIITSRLRPSYQTD